MHLESISIINYRSIQSLTIDLKQGIPNVFIGINDCGKSTILQAIDLLLGEKPKYNSIAEGQYKSDLSNTACDKKSFVEVFTTRGLPYLDYSAETTYVFGTLKFTESEALLFPEHSLSPGLQRSLENTADNKVHILKTFKGSSTQLYLLTRDDALGNQLWTLTQANLNKQLKKFGVTDQDIENENGKGRFSNFEKVRAAYNKTATSEVWAEHKFAKDDRAIIPEFKYFDWNCSFDDITSIANSIMKEHIEVQLNPLKKTAQEAADKAEIEINKKFGELSETIRSVAKGVEKINSKVHFDVKEKISDIMVKKISSDGLIHLENQGEGLKRQIWFSLIKSKAETKPENDINKFIWAFDEPETHLYPSAQRDFFDIINSISGGNVQTLVSTHSTVFVDKSKIETIQGVSQNASGYTEISYCKDVDSIHASLGVKNSDFLFFDKFLVVEGETEQHLIPKLFETYTGSSLLEQNIQLINIQGKDKWTLNKQMIDKIMTGFKKSEEQLVFLFDNDMSFEIGGAAKTANMFFVGYQDIEDAISSNSWVSVLNKMYEGKLEFTVEEIEAVKDGIPKGQRCESNQKFFKRMNSTVRNKWQEAGHDVDTLEKIPDKGLDSANFLLEGIKSTDDIPETIRQAFDQVSKPI